MQLFSQMTFKLGLSYLPLANMGLAALEKWAGQLPSNLLHPPLRNVLPYLDEYLKTTTTSKLIPVELEIFGLIFIALFGTLD